MIDAASQTRREPATGSEHVPADGPATVAAASGRSQQAQPHRPGAGRICFPLAGDLFGGSTVSTLHLVEELSRRGREVVVAVQGPGPVLEYVESRGVPVARLASMGRALPGRTMDGVRLGNLTSIPACVSFLRSRRMDIVHVNESRTLRSWSLASLLAGVPLVAHWRGNYKRAWSVDLGLRLASRVIAISEQNAARLPPWIRAKTSIVLNPFVTQGEASGPVENRDRLRAELGIPTGAAVIGLFGTLIARKRPHVLLDVLRAIQTTADGRPVVGLLCGERLEAYYDVKLDDRLRDEVLARRTIRPGYVSEPLRWMRLCDVVIVPAVDEPFGRVAIEAPSVGVPVIVSTGCGVKEVIEDGVSGVLLDPNDLDAWIAEVRRVLDEPARTARLVAGGRELAARLSVGRHADEVEDIYGSLIVADGGHPRRTPLLTLDAGFQRRGR